MARTQPTGRLAMSLLVSASLLSGCGQGAFSTQSARVGPDDGTDVCRPQLVALDSTGDFFGADILKGAAMGALAGGLAGGLIGGNWRSAAIGAGVGGVLGGAAGYWGALQQQSQDQAVLFSQVRNDIDRENLQIDRTQFA
ncbi:MAG TPA: YMGG-like glycine zipper-containing protein, partial [Acetobacteraceae bacterium]